MKKQSGSSRALSLETSRSGCFPAETPILIQTGATSTGAQPSDKLRELLVAVPRIERGTRGL